MNPEKNPTPPLVTPPLIPTRIIPHQPDPAKPPTLYCITSTGGTWRQGWYDYWFQVPMIGVLSDRVVSAVQRAYEARLGRPIKAEWTARTGSPDLWRLEDAVEEVAREAQVPLRVVWQSLEEVLGITIDEGLSRVVIPPLPWVKTKESP